MVKVDIEGSEIEVLDSCSDEFLKTIAQLTLELHDFTGQVSKAQPRVLEERLRRLGFFVIKNGARQPHRYVGNQPQSLPNLDGGMFVSPLRRSQLARLKTDAEPVAGRGTTTQCTFGRLAAIRIEVRCCGRQPSIAMIDLYA